MTILQTCQKRFTICGFLEAGSTLYMPGVLAICNGYARNTGVLFEWTCTRMPGRSEAFLAAGILGMDLLLKTSFEIRLWCLWFRL